MSPKQFYLGLSLTAGTTLLLLALLYQVRPDLQVWTFALAFTLIFTIFTVAMYFTGMKASRDKNPYKFSRSFLGFTFMKIMLSFLVIVGYTLGGGGESKVFLISFLPIYLIFTAYETYVFMKLSKNTPQTSN